MKRIRWTDDKLNHIKQLVLDGLTYKEIAERLDVPFDSIRTAVYRHKLPRALKASKRAAFRRRWTEDKLNQLRKLISDGLTYSEIAERTGVKSRNLKSVVYMYNLPRPRKAKRITPSYRRWTDDKLDHIRHLISDGLTYSEIAEKFNVKKGCINYVVRIYNLPHPRKAKRTMPLYRWPEERVNRLKELISKGLTYKELAKGLGTTVGAVNQVIFKKRLPHPARATAHFIVWTDEKLEQVRQLISDGLTYKEIAKRIGIKKSLLQYVVHRYHLPIPRRKNTPHFWTEDKIARLKELISKGLTYKGIAKELDVTKSAAMQAVYAKGIQHPVSEVVPSPKKIWTDEKLAPIKQLLSDGLSYSEIAERLNVKPQAIKSAVYSYNLPRSLKKSKGRLRPPPRWTEERIAEIKQLIAKGLGYDELAKHFGTTKQMMVVLVHQKKIIPRPVRKYRRKWSKEKIEEIKHLRAQGISNVEIARRFGMKTEAIGTIVRWHKLPPTNYKSPACFQRKWSDEMLEAIKLARAEGVSNVKIAQWLGIKTEAIYGIVKRYKFPPRNYSGTFSTPVPENIRSRFHHIAQANKKHTGLLGTLTGYARRLANKFGISRR